MQPPKPFTFGTRLAGKRAVVTGMGGGIGQACALLFAMQGAQVVGGDSSTPAAAAALKAAANSRVRVHSLHPHNLLEPGGARQLVSFAREVMGGIDIVVNAAAFAAFAWLPEMDYETQWRFTLQGELDIVFLLTQAVWPELIRAGGGAVINFASANAAMALPGSPALAHCAGKAGVLGMTRQLAMEGAPHGIRVNAISPALIETPATRAHMARDPDFVAQALAKAMLKRIGQPEDIAWAALYLASDEAAWVTAANLPVDAGATAW